MLPAGPKDTNLATGLPREGLTHCKTRVGTCENGGLKVSAEWGPSQQGGTHAHSTGLFVPHPSIMARGPWQVWDNQETPSATVREKSPTSAS